MLYLITIATIALLPELSGAWVLRRISSQVCGRRRVEGSGSGTALKECKAKLEAMMEFCETLESEPACQKFEEYLNETTNPDCDWIKLKEKTFKLFGSMVKAGQIDMEAVMEKAAENDEEETAGTVDPDQRRMEFYGGYGGYGANVDGGFEFPIIDPSIVKRRAEEEWGLYANGDGGLEFPIIDPSIVKRRAEGETEEEIGSVLVYRRAEEEAEQRKLDEEKRKREEKLARKAAAREEARKNGTYETKKQREARLAAERRRASMLASGMISADTKPSKPKFERKKKPKAPVVVEKAPEPEPEPVVEPEPVAEEPVDDWEAVDDWESGDVGANLEKLANESKAIDEEVEDEAELEAKAEAEKLKEAGRKLKERERKAREEEEARAEAEEFYAKGSWETNLVRDCYSKLAVKPVRMGAALFYSQEPMSGKLLGTAYHGACPSLTDVKWGANLWIWNRPRHLPNQCRRRHPRSRTTSARRRPRTRCAAAPVNWKRHHHKRRGCSTSSSWGTASRPGRRASPSRRGS